MHKLLAACVYDHSRLRKSRRSPLQSHLRKYFSLVKDIAKFGRDQCILAKTRHSRYGRSRFRHVKHLHCG